MPKNKVLTLIGQLRIYSILDLILLLIAIKANNPEFIGIIFLHLAFLLYLEANHKHSYRASFPKFLWIPIGIMGIVLYKNLAVLGFILASFLYTKKNKRALDLYSPAFRGLQYYFLVAGILGFTHPLAFLAFGVISVRNFTGDLRDVEKDRKEKLRTLPIVLGFNKNIKYIHLAALLLTSSIWWYFLEVSFLWLIGIYVIQIAVYNLTPR